MNGYFSINAQQIDLAPPTPSTPSVSLQANNIILVSWSDVSAQHYELSANVNGAWQTSVRGDNDTYNYAALPGNTYLFRVRACRGVYSTNPPTQPPLSGLGATTFATQTEFCSAWSSNSFSVSLAPIPAVPLSPNVTVAGNQATLTWTAVANSSHYIVTAAESSGQITEYVSSTSNTVITLKSGSSYILRVKACSASGCSQNSDAKTVSLAPTFPDTPSATQADTGGYLIYSDSSGNIYLQAPKQFVLIHGDVAIPLLITPKNGLLKLAASGSSWQLTVLTPSQWQMLQLTPGSTIVKSISYGDFDGDGVADIRLTFNNGQPAITVIGLTTIVKIITPVVTYLHTDVLGSVIAESDSAGNIIKKTDYKPFGQNSDQQ